MEMKHHVANGMLVIDVPEGEGRLVENDIDLFIDEILRLNNGKEGGIALNMRDVTYLNSSGLGDLIKVKDRLTDDNLSLILIHITSRVEALLQMVGVDRFFRIAKNEDELS